jgi:hypothetical protein
LSHPPAFSNGRLIAQNVTVAASRPIKLFCAQKIEYRATETVAADRDSQPSDGGRRLWDERFANGRLLGISRLEDDNPHLKR